MLLHSFVDINLTKPLIQVEQLYMYYAYNENLLNHFEINPGKITQLLPFDSKRKVFKHFRTFNFFLTAFKSCLFNGTFQLMIRTYQSW